MGVRGPRLVVTDLQQAPLVQVADDGTVASPVSSFLVGGSPTLSTFPRISLELTFLGAWGKPCPPRRSFDVAWCAVRGTLPGVERWHGAYKYLELAGHLHQVGWTRSWSFRSGQLARASHLLRKSRRTQ